jgi:hypothetical protein
MTAISMTLAAVMLNARSQWQLYASRSAEKNILEAASTAETQDFMHRVKKELESKGGSDPKQAGILSESELFLKDPFRRVELRGGVARTLVDGQPSDRSPLLYKKMNLSSLVSATAPQVNMIEDPTARNSIQLPSIWVPMDKSETDAAKNPAKLPLGKDDPFYDIYCRTSMAAIAAYSESRRPVGQGGVRGFGNVVSVQTRTFPASAFTYLQFDSESEITLSPPSYSSLGSTPPQSFDLGRVYTPGKVKIDSTQTLQSSGIVALRGAESTASPILPFFGDEFEDPPDEAEKERWMASLIAARDEKINEANEDYEEEYQDEVVELEAEVLHSLTEKHGNQYVLADVIAAYAASPTSPAITRLNKDVREKLEKHRRELNEITFERDRAISDANSKFEAAKSQYYDPPIPPSSGGGSSISIKSSPSGGRNKNRKLELVRSSTEKAEEDPEKVRASLDKMGEIWNKERVNAFRGTLVTSDNGGTSLVRNAATKTISGLIAEMSKYVDCSVVFEMTVPEPVTRWQNPKFAAAGLKLKVNTLKPTVGSLSWLGEGEASGSVFYWKRNEDGVSGMLVFDPSRMKFSAAVNATRPFSIYIDTSNIPSSWPLFVKTDGISEGITIISKNPVYLFGDFRSIQPSPSSAGDSVADLNIPSMIVAPEVYACAAGADTSKLATTVNATVITRAKDSTRLFRQPNWGNRSIFYPPAAVSVRVEGGSVAWEGDASTEPRIPTYATPPSSDLLAAAVAPALVPVVGEVRVSAGSPTTEKVIFAP